MKTEGGTSCQKHLISIFPPLVIVAEYISRSFNQKCGNKIRVGNKKIIYCVVGCFPFLFLF